MSLESTFEVLSSKPARQVLDQMPDRAWPVAHRANESVTENQRPKPENLHFTPLNFGKMTLSTPDPKFLTFLVLEILHF